MRNAVFSRTRRAVLYIFMALTSFASLADTQPLPESTDELVTVVRQSWIREPDLAIRAGKKALTLLEAAPAPDAHALLAGYLPRVYIDRGQLDVAQSVLDSYFNLPSPSSNLNDHARVLSNQGIIHKVTGNYLLAESTYLKAAQIYQTLGKSAALGNIYNNLARVSQSQNMPGEALAYYEKAIPLLIESNQPANLANLYSNIAEVNSEMGNARSAERFLRKAEILVNEAQEPRKRAEFLMKKAY